MHVVIAIDSFKGSLSSVSAARAVKQAVIKHNKAARVSIFPIADGGEGTVDALAAGLGGRLVEIPVTGPLGDRVSARYCILPDEKTAVIEMAAAAGLTLVPSQLRDPMVTTTFGVGEMIRDGLERGCRSFILGIGGSATNDGGAGMLSALGFSLLDEYGQPIYPGAEGLESLRSISCEGALPVLKECTFRIACDVTNPLCGPNGCSAVFAPQKGADEETVKKMDAWLLQYARLCKEHFPDADPNYPGAGAAGGLGFALRTFLGGSLEPGVQIVLECTGVEQAIREADLVITGEGRLDGQTVMGKVPVGVATIAKRYGKPVIAFCGCTGPGAEACKERGIDAYYPITPEGMPLQEAMDPTTAYQNLKNTAIEVFEKGKLL